MIAAQAYSAVDGYRRDRQDGGDALVVDRVSWLPNNWLSVIVGKAAYSGPLLRVRRSSDNAETDIYPAANGVLDTAALLAFCGAGSGYVTKMYDQTGQARDSTQTTAGSQWRIVVTGALETINGIVTPRSVTNTSYMADYEFAASGAGWTFGSVASSLSVTGNTQNVIGRDGAGYRTTGIYTQFSSTATATNFNRTGANVVVQSGANAVANTVGIYYLTHTSANVATAYFNGAAGTPSAAMTWTTGSLGEYRQGSYSTTAVTLLGTIQETWSFPQALTATDLNIIKTWESRKFGVTVV